MGADREAGQSLALVSSVEGIRAAQSQEVTLGDTWLGALTPTVPSDSVSPSVAAPHHSPIFTSLREFSTGHTLASCGLHFPDSPVAGCGHKTQFWPMRYGQKGWVQHLDGASKRKEDPDVMTGAAASILDPMKLYVDMAEQKGGRYLPIHHHRWSCPTNSVPTAQTFT